MSLQSISTDDTLKLSGVLSFASVEALYDDYRLWIVKKKQFIIDLCAIEHCDSAGLALLATWAKLAYTQKINLQFINAPSQLLSIAKISGIDDLFK